MNPKIRKIYDHICYDCHHGAQKGRCRRLPEKQLRREAIREIAKQIIEDRRGRLG